MTGASDCRKVVYICSDSVGETAESVARATIRQFDGQHVETRRFGHIRSAREIAEVIENAKVTGGFVAYTLVQPELREAMRAESRRRGVRAVDIMGPMIQAFIDTFHDSPKRLPGLLHQLDESYFQRVEAIEYTVRCDDGRDVGALPEADIVLIGISRTSKTPLSIYLAHKGYKVANYPLVPEIRVPRELYRVPAGRVIGLTMDETMMAGVRMERIQSVGLPADCSYASLPRVRQELVYAANLMSELGCPIVDVSNKAIEETAGIILDLLR